MVLFTTTLHQMMILCSFIFVGFLLRRCRIVPENADVTMSKMINYFFTPALIISNFSARCTPENLINSSQLIFYSILVIGLLVLIAVCLAPKFAKNRQEIGVFRYSITITNLGFMGNALVQGLWGSEKLFEYLIFCMTWNLFIYTVGVIWLTAGREKFRLRMLANPVCISVLVGVLLGLTHFPIPGFLNEAISSASACFSPMAMILTGYVIGKYDLVHLLKQRRIYVLTVLRLLVLPFVIWGFMLLLKAPQEATQLAVFMGVLPMGLNTIIFPVACGEDATPGASMALISNIIGLISVPLLMMFFLQW